MAESKGLQNVDCSTKFEKNYDEQKNRDEGRRLWFLILKEKRGMLKGPSLILSVLNSSMP